MAKENKPFEKNKDLKKLVLYTVIVNYGQGDNVLRIFKRNKSSAQFVATGEGTASKNVLDILAIEDNRKEIIYTVIAEDAINDIKAEIDAYFAINKRNSGIAYTISLSTVMGVALYKFLSQTVR